MSEILHHPGEFETYPEVKVPEETEIHKIPDVEYFKEEGYVPNEKFSRIMRMAHSEIGKILKSGKTFSYEKIQEAEDKFLERFDDLHSNEELLVKIFFGNALVNIRAAEIEKGANHKESNEFFKENIQQKHWIGNFVYENQNDPEIIEEFWKEYEATYNKLPVLQKERKYEDDRNKKNEDYSKEDNFKIDKSGILGEVAAMNLFNEISKEGKTKIKIEQASAEEDMKGIDFIVHFKNKYDESKTIIVQVKCVTKDQSNDENTVEFYSRFDFRDKKNLKNDKAQLLRKACFDYEREQRNSGDGRMFVSGGLWMEFTKVRNLQMIDNRGRIVDKEKKIDEKRKNLIKDQLKLQLELN
jgi:hypothetical protein